MDRGDRFSSRVTRVRTYLPLGPISARSWVALFALAAAGCVAEPAPEQTVEPLAPIAVSPEFRPAERSEIDSAFRQWLDATGGSVDLAPAAFGAQPSWTIEREPIERCGDTAHAAGCTRRREKRIELDAERIYPVEQIGEHTSELQSPCNLVCRLLLEQKKDNAAPRLTLVQPARHVR